LARLAIDSTVSVQGLAADYCEQSFKRSDWTNDRKILHYLRDYRSTM
jgi:hypothetical protein